MSTCLQQNVKESQATKKDKMTNSFSHCKSSFSHYEKEGNLMTQFLSIHQKNPDKRQIRKVIEIIDSGGIVLSPSETGFCFLGSAAIDSTHEKFLKLRPGHPKNKPFSLLCKEISQVSKVAYLTTQTFRIASRVWPGAYTFILPCSKNTPKVAAGPKRKTVGVRISNHPIIENIFKELDQPLLVKSVTDEEELIEQDYFSEDTKENSWWTNVHEICKQAPKGLINVAIDDGESIPIKVSSIIDFSQDPPALIRDGGIDSELIGIFNLN